MLREDFAEISSYLYRLRKFGEIFGSNIKDWSDLKHNQDFSLVMNLPKTDRHSMEEVYANGREFATGINSAIIAINDDFSQFPNLTSVIRRFDEVFIPWGLGISTNSARQAHESLDLNCYAFIKMCGLSDSQVELTQSIQEVITLLKRSELYLRENNIHTPPPGISHQVQWQINSLENSTVHIYPPAITSPGKK